jgi:hypothetical protein
VAKMETKAALPHYAEARPAARHCSRVRRYSADAGDTQDLRAAGQAGPPACRDVADGQPYRRLQVRQRIGRGLAGMAPCARRSMT